MGKYDVRLAVDILKKRTHQSFTVAQDCTASKDWATTLGRGAGISKILVRTSICAVRMNQMVELATCLPFIHFWRVRVGSSTGLWQEFYKNNVWVPSTYTKNYHLEFPVWSSACKVQKQRQMGGTANTANELCLKGVWDLNLWFKFCWIVNNHFPFDDWR